MVLVSRSLKEWFNKNKEIDPVNRMPLQLIHLNRLTDTLNLAKKIKNDQMKRNLPFVKT